MRARRLQNRILCRLKFALVLSGLLLGLAVRATAAPTEYQVAVIVFAQPLDTDEDLSDQSPFAWASDMREPIPLPEAQSGLFAAYEQLRRAPNLRPLLHLAWLQAVEPGQVSAPYHVRGAEVEGMVSLEQGEHLYASVDIEYRPADGMIYRLREKRQLKLDEIHYLDHPAFGVLIKLSRP